MRDAAELSQQRPKITEACIDTLNDNNMPLPCPITARANWKTACTFSMPHVAGALNGRRCRLRWPTPIAATAIFLWLSLHNTKHYCPIYMVSVLISRRRRLSSTHRSSQSLLPGTAYRAIDRRGILSSALPAPSVATTLFTLLQTRTVSVTGRINTETMATVITGLYEYLRH